MSYRTNKPPFFMSGLLFSGVVVAAFSAVALYDPHPNTQKLSGCAQNVHEDASLSLSESSYNTINQQIDADDQDVCAMSLIP